MKKAATDHLAPWAFSATPFNLDWSSFLIHVPFSPHAARRILAFQNQFSVENSIFVTIQVWKMFISVFNAFRYNLRMWSLILFLPNLGKKITAAYQTLSVFWWFQEISSYLFIWTLTYQKPGWPNLSFYKIQPSQQLALRLFICTPSSVGIQFLTQGIQDYAIPLMWSHQGLYNYSKTFLLFYSKSLAMKAKYHLPP